MWFLILTIAVCTSNCFASKILLVSMPMRSHVFEGVNLVDGLHTRGHEISLVLNSAAAPIYEKLLKGKNIQVSKYNISFNILILS